MSLLWKTISYVQLDFHKYTLIFTNKSYFLCIKAVFFTGMWFLILWGAVTCRTFGFWEDLTTFFEQEPCYDNPAGFCLLQLMVLKLISDWNFLRFSVYSSSSSSGLLVGKEINWDHIFILRNDFYCLPPVIFEICFQKPTCFNSITISNL